MSRISHLIADALCREQRYLEISIWIDRLNMWWEHRENADEKEQEASCRSDYLNVSCFILQEYARETPDKAAPLVLAYLPEVEALNPEEVSTSGCDHIFVNTAAAQQNCGYFTEAISLYQTGMQLLPDEYRWMAGRVKYRPLRGDSARQHRPRRKKNILEILVSPRRS